MKNITKLGPTCIGILVVLLLLCGCSYQVNIPKENLEVSPFWELLVDETIGNNRLLVYSYGGPALLVKYRCIRGSGLDARIINGTVKKTVFTYNQGEIEGDLIIDYSDAESDIFRFTDCTCDPREDEEVPFLLETVTVRKDGTTSVKQEIVLKPEEGDLQRIQQLRDDALRVGQKEDEESGELESILGHLRNIGIKDPDNVLEAFESLSGKLGCGGGELLGMYESEIQLVKELMNKGKE